MGPGSAPRRASRVTACPGRHCGKTAFTFQTARDPTKPAHDIAASRRMTPEWCIEHVPLIVAEGAGKAGCWPHPWPPCERKCTGQEPQVRPVHPGLPCAMVLTVSFVLSLGIGFLAPICDNAPSAHCAGLSVERPGPHDFSVREGAGRLPAPPRPPHPCPDVRDDAYAPLRWDRMRASLLIFGICQAEIFTL
jgi:hypothetical protein